jgi:hypothetical protein
MILSQKMSKALNQFDFLVVPAAAFRQINTGISNFPLALPNVTGSWGIYCCGEGFHVY